MLIEPTVYEDHRGFFMESYQQEHYKKQYGIHHHFVQDNHSYSKQMHTLRGLHYQNEPFAQIKLVSVIVGAIYDVAVDMRKDSPTFGKWEAFVLNEFNKHQLLIPKGFAHGFCTLESHTHVMYKVDEYYNKEHDRGIMWNDPTLNISWPTSKVVLSEKDKAHPSWEDIQIP